MIARWNKAGAPPPRIPGRVGGIGYLEGIQENVELEFVDPSGSRRISPDDGPLRKRRAAHGARAGLTMMESMGLASKDGPFYAL